MMKRLLFFCHIMLVFVVFASCDDNDSFTTNPSSILSFSKDTVSLDTVFSTVPTSTYTFWIYNHNDDGLRLSQVRLARGNQSGFRVNVDGTYLDNTMGSLVRDLEVRGGDSIRVFVELTSSLTNSSDPQLVEDNLVFTLESGTEQRVNLRAYSWDALLCRNVVISRDTTIASSKPVVVYGGLTVDSGATLTVTAPTKLYFHSDAGIDVYGRLVISGSAGNDVVLRGDRTDRMFDYLPYDRVSGQWQGIRFRPSSTGNTIAYADIHSATDGIVCDSAAYDSISPRLSLANVTIHNCKGAGLRAYNSNIKAENCQITNTLGDCMAIYGGKASVLYCTLAQFYPFDAQRGVALRFANRYGEADYPLHLMECRNSLVTGYASDEMMGETGDTLVAFNYRFYDCILRTPPIGDSLLLEKFVNVVFEVPEDTVQGTDHFVNIDTDNLYYDFHLDSLSTARGRAKAIDACPLDRDGRERGQAPDVGCYQYFGREGATSGRR